MVQHKDVLCDFKSNKSRRIQWPVKIMRAVRRLQILLSLIELCKSFPKWGQ